LQQIGPVLVYTCVALIVPALIARFLIRAEWRLVRNACILWYGFLILAFGGPFKAEAVSWSMIFAMYFSILAVPMIALVLRLISYVWKRFGRSSYGKPS
jgi:hypothetical protein